MRSSKSHGSVLARLCVGQQGRSHYRGGACGKASVIGRTGLMLLECGTGAWRVRSSMNTLSRELGVTTTADIGLLSIEFTCFDGDQCYTQSLCLTNTGENTSRLNRLAHFFNDFDREGKFMTGEELHSHLDEIERIHGLYSPIALGFAAALACGCFTFCLAAALWKCCVPSAVQASATLYGAS